MKSQRVEDLNGDRIYTTIRDHIQANTNINIDHLVSATMGLTEDTLFSAVATANHLNTLITPPAFQAIETGTEKIGTAVKPIAEHPWIKYVSKIPGINWLLTGLGQVDAEKAQKDVDQLRREYPLETPQQLAHRIMVDTAVKAGGFGLVTNIIPPLALTLFAVDIAAITTLQAEMVYRIASVYGFSLNEPTRRGEVLAIFGLSLGSSGPIKLGLSFFEILPFLGAFIGASSNAALIYTLGYVTCRFYETKQAMNSPLPA